ncbi:hypothetical protein [Streptomyces sp. NPDC021969]|uniref:hypothetical protein n=1 Tax=unclassified Streptomyces TaxID=2593676 RepID=UPI0033E86FB1
MNEHTRRHSARAILAWSIALFVTSCTQSSPPTVPEKICGTAVAPALTETLVDSDGEWDEYNRVDRGAAISAPCVLLSDNERVLEFRFWWTEDKPDLMYLARSGSVAGINDPQRINAAEDSVIGIDGALSTTSCKTKKGEYFTLTLQIPQIQLTDNSHRKDIETFMRAYFPATVKTLECG